jgi:hypothetical protein
MSKRKRVAGLLAAVCTLAFGLVTAFAQSEVGPVLPVLLNQLDNITKSVSECQLGDLAADAIRDSLGTTVSVLGSGDLIGDLGNGAVTQEDLDAALADRPLVTAEVTPAQLYTLMEGALSQVVVDLDEEQIVAEESQFDGFAQISGFQMVWDGSAPVGERVYSLTLDDGTKLSRTDEETSLTIAGTDLMLEDGYGYGCDAVTTATQETTHSALMDYLTRYEISSLDTGRISVIGTRDSALVGQVSKTALLAVLAIIAVFMVFFRGKLTKARKSFLPMEEGTTRKQY